MAGEWLKVDRSTPDKPEVIRMARLLKKDRDLVFGKLLRLWCWFDSNSVDGVVDGVVDADVDDLCQCEGFAQACITVGWMTFDPVKERITLPNFDRHNGETAKQRMLKNRRQARWRAHVDAKPSTSASTNSSTREEKRREEKKKIKSSLDHRADDRTRIESDFDTRFWPAYPRKVGKENARKAFVRIKPDGALLGTMLAALEREKLGNEQWRRDDGQFIPHPATWLNGKRWLDDARPSAEPLNGRVAL